MKYLKQMLCVSICGVMLAAATGCSGSLTGGKRIIRISHAQSETHPEHLGLLKFKEYVEANLGNKYEVQIFPNELLGSAQKAIELTQTGAIDFVVAGTANLETFADVYEIFSMPYLFTSEEAYHAVMNDTDYMENVYDSTDEAGFRVMTWYNAGTRNFYATTPIYTPDDLKGLKIRVQDMKSQTDMMNYLGGIPVAMSYGDVYTSLQTGIIDGTENNETALTTGKHGEVCKVYSVDQHAMIPDVLIMSEKVWKQISPEDQQIILEAAHNSTEAHKVMWDTAIDEAVKEAQETMGVEFVYDVDKEAFREATQPMIEAYENEYPGVKTLMDTIEAAREGE